MPVNDGVLKFVNRNKYLFERAGHMCNTVVSIVYLGSKMTKGIPKDLHSLQSYRLCHV